MQGEIIYLVQRKLIYIEVEYFSGFSFGVNSINNDNLFGSLWRQDEVKENPPNACSRIDDRDILRQLGAILKIFCYVRPEAVVTEKNIATPQDDNVPVRGI